MLILLTLTRTRPGPQRNAPALNPALILSFTLTSSGVAANPSPTTLAQASSPDQTPHHADEICLSIHTPCMHIHTHTMHACMPTLCTV